MSSPKLSIILAPEARRDHEHIQLYTMHEWGEQQWDAYEASLDQALTVIGDNPDIGRSRDELRTGVRSYLVGQHIIFYRVTPEAILILRIRHSRIDPGSVLRGAP